MDDQRTGTQGKPHNAVRRGKMVRVNCNRQCRLHPDNLPPGVGDMVHAWIEEGVNNPTVIARGAEMGVKFSNGSIGNHKAKHLKLVGENLAMAGDRPASVRPKLTELEVVDQIIQEGGHRLGLSTQGVSTEQLLRAIELKYKLTQGSVFEAMYKAMQGVGGPDDDDLEDLDPASQIPERPSALRSDEEAEQAAAAE